MSRTRVLGIVGLAGLFGALIGCGAKPAATSSPPPAAPLNVEPVAKGQPSAPNTPDSGSAHEMDPTKHVIAQRPVSGQLKGKAFNPDRVEIEGNRLIFRQGKDFFADLSIEVILDNNKVAADGLKLVAKPTQKWSDGIPTLLAAATTGKGLPDSKFINDGYAMTLELGKVEKGKSSGKVYLCLPDAEKSFLVGTFTAERKRSISDPPTPEDVPFIQGTVSPPLKKGQEVSVGYVGLPTGSDKPISDGVGGKAFDSGSGGGVRSTTFSPRTATFRVEKFTPQFDFTHLPPGRYLVYARIKDGPAAWNWTDVAAGAQVATDIKLDAVKMGTVEVKLPASESDVRLVPTDLGTPSPGDRFLDQLVYSLNFEAEAKDGIATIKNVPVGNYQVRAGRLRGTVEVTADKTATVELKSEK